MRHLMHLIRRNQWWPFGGTIVDLYACRRCIRPTEEQHH
jgi:hypothetical protein